MELTGPQHQELTQALTNAFPNYEDLRGMVRSGLSMNLNEIAGSTNVKYASYDLVTNMQARGWIPKLVNAARNEMPDNPRLRAIAEKLHLVTPVTDEHQNILSDGELQRIVLKSVHFQNVAPWKQKMSISELPVCRIDIGGTPNGTGFLVGPDLLITNYHVLQDVFAHPSQRDTVVLNFDYKTDANGMPIDEWPKFRLKTQDWWLSYSHELDYVLLAVDGDPGNQSVGGQGGARQRGWLQPVSSDFEQGQPIALIQHPKGAMMKTTLGSFLQWYQPETRIVYTANTDDGSSGSPCFNINWDLVALHHHGDSNGNRGIPFSAILDHLESEGLREIVGIAPPQPS